MNNSLITLIPHAVSGPAHSVFALPLRQHFSPYHIAIANLLKFRIKKLEIIFELRSPEPSPIPDAFEQAGDSSIG
jgi:hypothetical protein